MAIRFGPISSPFFVPSPFMRPLLLQFARSQVRVAAPPSRYDEDLDELVVADSGRWVPALDSTEKPETKKADLEKGEDQKDRWGR